LCHITVKEDFEYYHLEIKYTTVIDVDKIYSKRTDFIDYKPAICLNKQMKIEKFLVLFYAWLTENSQLTLTHWNDRILATLENTG